MRPRLQDSNPVSADFFARWWVVFVLGAALLVALAGYARARQVERIRDTDREAAAGQYAGGRHWLVVPDHNTRSYQWLAQTEQMLAGGEWRVRQVANENAPEGREVHTASPYRWWLGAIAWASQTVTGNSRAQAVEQAALWSGPLLHLLLLATTALYVARRFGPAPAAFFSLGLALLFPLAGDFVPGVPDDHALAVCAVTWMTLLLAGGLHGHRTDFVFSGIAGGLGLWVSVSAVVPAVGAIALGALVLAAMERSTKAAAPAPPWDRWALAGAITSLLAYFAEYYPGHLDLRLQANHPLYGVAWLGLGQLLGLAGRWSRRTLKPDVRAFAAGAAALAGLAALPVTMKLNASPAFLVANPQADRLADLVGSPVATSLAAWLGRDGLSLALIATVLPFTLLIPAWLAAAKSPDTRALAGFGLGALLLAVATASMQLQAWGWGQVLLLVALVSIWPKSGRAIWLVAAFVLMPGLVQLAGTARARDAGHFSQLEAEGLIERDIAHWIADHADPGALVLAAPDRTPALNYLGGLRGLGTPNWENTAGVAATLRILASTTAEEAQAQLAQRGVTHLVLVSWDRELETLVRWSSTRPDDTFYAALRRWALPPWLQPLPYRLPETGGFEGQSVVILQVTENTDRALALGRMADYALEVQDQAMASAVDDSLQAFPASLAALTARAQLAKAREDNAGFERVLAPLTQSLANGLDRTLPWDRRMGLAVVLAQGGRNDQAATQLRRCVAELNESRLRSLAPSALYRLLVLSRALSVPLPDALRASALALLPAEARARL